MTLVQRIADLRDAVLDAVMTQRAATVALQKRMEAVEQALTAVTPSRVDVQAALAATLKDACDSNRRLLKILYAL